jgi:CubicO group peptidase (beta-lactamase class C family)
MIDQDASIAGSIGMLVLRRKRVISAHMEASVAIVEDGKVVTAQGIDLPVPWWSFTKTIIAAAALVLVRERRLQLDQALTGRTFSLRQLLAHRAGVTNYGGLAAYHEAVRQRDEPWPVPVLLERTHADRLRFKPGQGWAYSNIGYLFVRELIEETCGENFGAALSRLVLHPLGIDGVRLAEVPADLAGVAMGDASSYHPGWVYHGLLVGRVADAALLHHRLMSGALMPADLRNQMLDRHRLGGPIEGRPWRAPGYGLGLMTGITSDGHDAIGHTGCGPGSAIAVYHLPQAASRFTAAAFAFGDNEARVEEAAFRRGQL